MRGLNPSTRNMFEAELSGAAAIGRRWTSALSAREEGRCDWAGGAKERYATTRWKRSWGQTCRRVEREFAMCTESCMHVPCDAAAARREVIGRKMDGLLRTWHCMHVWMEES